MKQANLAERYAKALLQIGVQQNNSALLAEQLLQFRNVLENNKPLSALFVSPLFPQEQRRAVVQAVCKRLRFEKTTQDFLSLLVDKKRTNLFSVIQETFQKLLHKQNKQLYIQVVSAETLSENYLFSLQQHFQESLQQEIHLQTEVDAKLLAGVLVRVGNTIYDGTLRTRLQRMKEHLLQQTA